LPQTNQEAKKAALSFFRRVASFVLKIQLCCACGNWIFKTMLEPGKTAVYFFLSKK
jgi:hypothetical protein